MIGIPERIDDALAKGFWNNVDKRGPGDCWPWRGRQNEHGYGIMSIRGKETRAHRLSWSMANGRKEPGPCVIHACDNPRCVAPHHLRSGTKAENSADMARKGRSAQGERNGMAKLSRKQVKDVLTSLGAGMSQAEIARTLNVSPTAIVAVVNGQSWSHLTGIEPQRPGLPTGERHGNTKTTAADVLEICRRLDNGETGTSLAAEFGVSITTISRIKLGQSWSSVTGRGVNGQVDHDLAVVGASRR